MHILACFLPNCNYFSCLFVVLVERIKNMKEALIDIGSAILFSASLVVVVALLIAQVVY